MFRKSYRKNEAMEDNRNLLKDKYSRGKQLGGNVNTTRQAIKDLSNQIEQIRKQNALRGLVDENGEIERTKEEDELQAKIARHKQAYQAEYNELKDLKTEIERIQNLLERCRVKMQKDFEQWITIMVKHKQAPGGQAMPQAQQPALGSTDKRVNDNLAAFYKARDAIYEEVKKQ